MWDYLFNSRKILKRDRYPWIDYARGICIILVSYRHFFSGVMTSDQAMAEYPTLSYLNIFFFSFRMPLFFIVSGVFLRLSLQAKGTGNFVKNRVQTIFYPLIVWGIIHISLQLIFSDYVNANRVPSDYFRLLYQPRAIEQFWYLNALFFVSILYALISVYARFTAINQLVLGILLYAVAGYLHANEIEAGFITDVFFFYFFFAVGDMISGVMLNPANFKKFASYKILLLILPVFILVQHYFTHLNLTNKNDYYVQNNQPVLFALAAILGGGFVICVSFLLQKTNKLRFLRVIGYHSLYIYVANLIVTASVRILFVNVLNINNIPFLLVLGSIAGVIIPIIFYNVAEKAGAWWLYTLNKPRGGKSAGNGKAPAATAMIGSLPIPIVQKETSQ